MIIQTRSLNTLKHRTKLVQEFYLGSITKKMQLVQLNMRRSRPHFILIFTQETEGKRDFEDVKVIAEIPVINNQIRFSISPSEQYPELAKHEAEIFEQVTKIISTTLGYTAPVADTYY